MGTVVPSLQLALGALKVARGQFSSGLALLEQLAAWAGQPGEALLQAAWPAHSDKLQAMDRPALELQLAATGAPAAALRRPLSCPPICPPSQRPALVHALVRRADVLRRLGRSADALADARLAWQTSLKAPPLDPGQWSFCNLVAQAAAVAGDTGSQATVLQAAVAWVDGGLPHGLPALGRRAHRTA